MVARFYRVGIGTGYKIAFFHNDLHLGNNADNFKVAEAARLLCVFHSRNHLLHGYFSGDFLLRPAIT